MNVYDEKAGYNPSNQYQGNAQYPLGQTNQNPSGQTTSGQTNQYPLGQTNQYPPPNNQNHMQLYPPIRSNETVLMYFEVRKWAIFLLIFLIFYNLRLLVALIFAIIAYPTWSQFFLPATILIGTYELLYPLPLYALIKRRKNLLKGCFFVSIPVCLAIAGIEVWIFLAATSIYTFFEMLFRLVMFGGGSLFLIYAFYVAWKDLVRVQQQAPALAQTV
jgi:hypothetical protein